MFESMSSDLRARVYGFCDPSSIDFCCSEEEIEELKENLLQRVEELMAEADRSVPLKRGRNDGVFVVEHAADKDEESARAVGGESVGAGGGGESVVDEDASKKPSQEDIEMLVSTSAGAVPGINPRCGGSYPGGFPSSQGGVGSTMQQHPRPGGGRGDRRPSTADQMETPASLEWLAHCLELQLIFTDFDRFLGERKYAECAVSYEQGQTCLRAIHAGPVLVSSSPRKKEFSEKDMWSPGYTYDLQPVRTRNS